MAEPPPPSHATPLDERLLHVIEDLVAELRRGGHVPRVRLDDSLERDLGISSLERVELVLRLERAFGVQLGDAVMTEADTPADLVAALQTAAPADDLSFPSDVRPPIDAATPAPDSAATLVDVLRWHGEQHPDRIHVYLRDGDTDERPITYGELWQRATAVAAGLRSRGIGRRDTVAIMLRTEAAFFPAFFGTLLAGAIPVPMYPPFRADRIQEYAERQVGILRNADARLLITFAQIERVAKLLAGRVPSLSGVVTIDELTADGPPARLPAVTLQSGDPALIQYTSGSTGDPKGVLLTHANLLANIRAIRHSLAIGPGDVAVSWLPLYHDMGLIGAWLGALYFATPLVVLSPLAFLARPARWLWALHTYRGTISPAPNFAYDLCAQRIADRELEGLDLSSVRLLLNGSETVVPETVDRFVRRFAAHGLRPEALCPVYGLAECSVGLTATPLGQVARVDAVRRTTFQASARAEPAPAGDPAPLRFVSCGRPLPDHEIRVVDERGRVAGERTEGRVQFRGPSVTAGYFRNPEATRAIVTADGWMDSGDLGYVAGGELFLTGRRKDMVIKAGRNIYPQEVEELAASVGGVRKGCVAAFGLSDAEVGTERLVVVAETRETDSARRAAIRDGIVERIASIVGMPPDDIVLAPPGAVLKTSSGKIRRGATRDAYCQGDLARRPPVAVQWLRLVGSEASARARRLGDSIVRFAFTGYAIGLVTVTLPAFWTLLAAAKRGAPANRIVRGWSKLVIRSSGAPLIVEGADRLRELGPAVFVANHESYLDPIVVLAAVPVPVTFAAKRGLTAYPLLGTAIRKAGYVTIERADVSQRMEGAEDVAAVLRRGESLFVFPEGTFRPEPGLLPFRLGAFRAAVEAGRPVVPVTIHGTRRILPDPPRLLRPGRIVVTIGEPISANDTGWPEMVRLRDQAREAIERRLGEEDL